MVSLYNWNFAGLNARTDSGTTEVKGSVPTHCSLGAGTALFGEWVQFRERISHRSHCVPLCLHA